MSIFSFITGEKRKYNRFIKQGGLWAENATLLSTLLAENLGFSEELIDDNIIKLTRKMHNGYEQYGFYFTDSQILAGWELSTNYLGTHNLEWSFDRDMDQRKIAIIMSSGAGNYKLKIC